MNDLTRMLQPHEERVMRECDDLLTNIRKLETFLTSNAFFDLPPTDRRLLHVGITVRRGRIGTAQIAAVERRQLRR